MLLTIALDHSITWATISSHFELYMEKFGTRYVNELPFKLADYMVFTFIATSVLSVIAGLRNRGRRLDAANKLRARHLTLLDSLRLVIASVVAGDTARYDACRETLRESSNNVAKDLVDTVRYYKDDHAVEVLADYVGRASKIVEAFEFNLTTEWREKGSFDLASLNGLYGRLKVLYQPGEHPVRDVSFKARDLLSGLGLWFFPGLRVGLTKAQAIDFEAVKLLKKIVDSRERVVAHHSTTNEAARDNIVPFSRARSTQQAA